MELVVTQTIKKFPAFNRTEYSLQCSQGPVTGPYHDPDTFSSEALCYIS